MNETSVTTYQPTQHNIREDLNVVLYCQLSAYFDSIFQASVVNNCYQGTGNVCMYLGGLADEEILEGCPEIQNCCEGNPYVLGIYRIFVV
jgi:hypothetical protein